MDVERAPDLDRFVVKLEHELAALLQMRMEADRKMLQAMGGPG